MNALARLLVTAAGALAARRFDRACADPAAAQARVLARLLARNAGTAFGRAHGLARARDGGDLARAVPLQAEADLRPWVARHARGEPGVLTAERVLAFASTSGTTAAPKLVPVTASYLDALQRAARVWLFHAARAHPGLLRGAFLALSGDPAERQAPCGLPVGACSGHTARRVPWLLRRAQVLPPALARLRDPDARYLAAARLALAREDVALVATPNPTTLLRLLAVAAAHGERLVQAVHDGTLGLDLDALAPGDAAVAREVERGLRPDPARARVLAALRRRGALEPAAVWPRLALVGCWLGGSAGVVARRLDGGFPAPRRDLGLRATEVPALTIPLQDGAPAGALNVEAAFYEFLPEDGGDGERPRLAHELEPGARYRVVVTTEAGLWRYDLQDVVQVTGLHGRAPVLAFLRKQGELASITGEKLHANHALAAARRAEQATGVELVRLRLVPDVDALRYDALLEPARPLSRERLDAFVGALDRALCDENPEYACKRASRRLGAPCGHLMRRGWSERQWRRDVAAGQRDVQHKWRVIAQGWDDASRGEVIASTEAHSAAHTSTTPPAMTVTSQAPSGESSMLRIEVGRSRTR